MPGSRSGWIWCSGAILLILVFVGAARACDLPPPPRVSAPRQIFRLDQTKSLVRFDAKAFLHDVSGKTSKIQGTIRLADQEHLSDAEGCIRIDAASLETGARARDAIMRGDHLETHKYPTIAFDLTQVEQARPVAGGWEFVARGLLTLHGVSREMPLAIRGRRDGEAVRLSGEVAVKMSDHQIPTPTLLFLAVEDQVVVHFDVTALRTP